jgi:hypothetical protein
MPSSKRIEGIFRNAKKSCETKYKTKIYHFFKIHFECGEADNLMSVNESQKCLYVFHLMTPAAC